MQDELLRALLFLKPLKTCKVLRRCQLRANEHDSRSLDLPWLVLVSRSGCYSAYRGMPKIYFCCRQGHTSNFDAAIREAVSSWIAREPWECRLLPDQGGPADVALPKVSDGHQPNSAGGSAVESDQTQACARGHIIEPFTHHETVEHLAAAAQNRPISLHPPWGY